MTTSPKRPSPHESRHAISLWFLLNGFVTASWLAHVPRQSEALDASPGPLGLALLCMAIGSVVGMSAAPASIGRWGSGRAAWLAGWAYAFLVPLPIVAPSVFLLGAGLLAFGAAHGLMDVTMNSAAAECERHYGRAIMSSFHGWFSFGMVVGIAGGVAALTAGLPPLVHAALVIAIALSFLQFGKSRCEPIPVNPAHASHWRDGINRQSVALAGLAFVCLFLEGAMADWAGLLSAAFGADSATAPTAYFAFTATWAGGRFMGDRLNGLVGDATIVRLGGLFTALGVGIGLLIGTPAGVAIGCAIVGLGLANAVPLLFRAGAAADPTGRGRGLVLVTGVGYAGFLVGPPLVGFTAEVVGLPRAMVLVIAGGIVLAMGATILRSRRGLQPDADNRVTLRCRAVLFDMDGTLLDSSTVTEQIWRDWSASKGLDPAPILAIHHGRRPEETLAAVYPEHATPEVADTIQKEGESRPEGLVAIAGIHQFIDSLGDSPWAVVTSATEQLAAIRIKAVDLWREVPLVGAEHVKQGKPSPEGYLAAAQMLEVDPRDCLVFEDAPAGLEAARRAGMTAIGVVSTHDAADLDADHLIRDYRSFEVLRDRDGMLEIRFRPCEIADPQWCGGDAPQPSPELRPALESAS